MNKLYYDRGPRSALPTLRLSPALILAAHGAGDQSTANQFVRKLAFDLEAKQAFVSVQSAFRLGTPSFAEVLDEVIVERVLVLPLMTSDGWYYRTVLPRELARSRRYPEVRIQYQEPIGLHPHIPEIALEQVNLALEHSTAQMSDNAVVVVGHGTHCDPRSNGATFELATSLRERNIFATVEAAFLDDSPGLEEVVGGVQSSSGRRPIIILPFLIGGGEHTLADLPRRLAGCNVFITPPLGNSPRFTELIKRVALGIRWNS